VTAGISSPHAGEARPLSGVASVRHSRQPCSGGLTSVLRETPVATVGRVGSSDQEVGIDYTILRPNNFYQKDHGLKDVIVNYVVYPQPMSARLGACSRRHIRPR
jgi:hypothetical protein